MGNHIDLDDALDVFDLLKKRYPDLEMTQKSIENIDAILGSLHNDPTERTIGVMAARYLYKFITRHPLTNGNKRFAVVMTNRFLYQNGYRLMTWGEMPNEWNVMEWLEWLDKIASGEIPEEQVIRGMSLRGTNQTASAVSDQWKILDLLAKR